MAVPLMAIVALAQLGYGIYKEIDNNKKKAPIDTMPDPQIGSEAKTYEWVFRDLAQKRTSADLEYGKTEIDRSKVNTVQQANEVFSDPGMRFRAGILASAQADTAKTRLMLESGRMESELMGQAGKFGVSHQEMRSRVYNQLLATRIEQQRMYDQREEANAELIGAGISNLAGTIETQDFLDAIKDLKTTPEATKTEVAAPGSAPVMAGPPPQVYKDAAAGAKTTPTTTPPPLGPTGANFYSITDANGNPHRVPRDFPSWMVPTIPDNGKTIATDMVPEKSTVPAATTTEYPLTKKQQKFNDNFPTSLSGGQRKKLQRKWGDDLTDEELITMEYGEKY